MHRWLLTVAWLALGSSASTAAPLPRMVPAKPATTVLRDGDASDRIVVKFRDETGARLRQGRFVGAAMDTSAVETILQAHGVETSVIRRLFTRPEADLENERERAQQRSGRALADLNLYYSIAVPSGGNAAQLCDALNALPDVELAQPVPRPRPAPVDISPTTPDFTDLQGYRGAPPTGIGLNLLPPMPGIDGDQIAIVDIEYDWVLDHEDLELDALYNLDTATMVDPLNGQGNHGTAVLGELVGKNNGYGVTGLVPSAILRVAPANTSEYGYDIGRAVSLAIDFLLPGDVILIEQQVCVCGQVCDDATQVGFGPVEWYSPWADVIEIATSLDISVLEPAGNGRVNLDGAGCQRWFDRTRRDSGAIIIGSAVPGTRAPTATTSYGSRVDLQGWGSDVTTLGYGDLFDPGDRRQRYTQNFAGTSSATPIVAASVAIIQGVRLGQGLQLLTARSVRHVLVDTGTPQSGPGNIGPLPDLPSALALVLPDVTPTPRPSSTRTASRTPTKGLKPTPTPSVAATRTRTPTRPATPTRTRTPNATATRTRSPTRTRTASPQTPLSTLIHGVFGAGGKDWNGDGRLNAADVVCLLSGCS